VLKQGIVDWGQTMTSKLQEQLLAPQTVALSENLGLEWVPQDLTLMAGGLLHVPGQFRLLRQNSSVKPTALERTYDDSTLAAVKESGFILPSDTLPKLIQYLYQTGDLRYRVNSASVSSFTSLMGSRFFQFFIWPDLMNFSSRTSFWFDISSEAAPKLANGEMNPGGGIAYRVSAPLLVNQWAPGEGQYVPYLDFRAPMTGELNAKIDDGKLSIQLSPNDLNVSAVYRPEYQKIRRIDNNWIATGILGSNVQSYLQSQAFQFTLPSWDLGQGMTLGMRDLQIWHQSFRIPLQLTSSP
jgi:hypothetical protein